jgi:hypothetical protein
VPNHPHHIQIPKWQRRLPQHYVIASSPSANSFDLNVDIQTMDTGKVHAMSALLDCGMTGLFIDTNFVQCHHLSTRPLARAIPMYNIDGTPNEAGFIHEVVDAVL